MTAFDLSALTPAQRGVVEGAIARCDFPFELCLPALRQRWGRPAIVVTWEPLEPYLGGAGHKHIQGIEHPAAHPVEARGRIAGLAWTDGRIMLAPWLEPHAEVAVEVFLAEAAHQVDFFFITSEQRRKLFALFHHGDPTPHEDHGWFEEEGGTNYWDWAGESWMAAFTLAYSDVVPDWMDFTHRVTTEARGTIRAILGVPEAPPAPESPPVPEVPPVPEPPVEEPVEELTYFGGKRSPVFHDNHEGIRADLRWALRDHAIAAGRRSCRVCKP